MYLMRLALKGADNSKAVKLLEEAITPIAGWDNHSGLVFGCSWFVHQLLRRWQELNDSVHKFGLLSTNHSIPEVRPVRT